MKEQINTLKTKSNCITSHRVFQLRVYPQLIRYLWYRGIEYIDELKNSNREILEEKLRVKRDVCDYIYEKIQEYYEDITNSSLICSYLPDPCRDLSIEILNLSDEIYNTLKQDSINTIGELASLPLEENPDFIQIKESVKNLVKNFWDNKIILKEVYCKGKIEKKDSGIFIEYSIKPYISDNTKLSQKERTVEYLIKPTPDIVETPKTVETTESEFMIQDSKTLETRSDITDYNLQITDSPSSIDLPVITKNDLINILKSQNLIKRRDKYNLSFEQISKELVKVWDVPIENVPLFKDNNISDLKSIHIKTLGELFENILENNLNWLKNSNIKIGDNTPVTLDLTPILIYTKQLKEEYFSSGLFFKKNIFKTFDIVRKISNK